MAASAMDIFPVGWCDSNDYPLELPHTSRLRVKIKQTSEPDNGYLGYFYTAFYKNSN